MGKEMMFRNENKSGSIIQCYTNISQPFRKNRLEAITCGCTGDQGKIVILYRSRRVTGFQKIIFRNCLTDVYFGLIKRKQKISTGINLKSHNSSGFKTPSPAKI